MESLYTCMVGWLMLGTEPDIARPDIRSGAWLEAAMMTYDLVRETRGNIRDDRFFLSGAAPAVGGSGAPGPTMSPPAVAEAAAGALARMMALRDPETGRHMARVAALAGGIARSLGLDDAEVNGIRLAASLHDVGKVGVPLALCNKSGPLTLPELQMLQTHPVAGEQIVAGIPFAIPVAQVIRQHHERLDGSGYPDGLSGDAILPGARIVAVADVLEAMVTDRTYRHAPGIDAAIAELQRGRGTLYEPSVVDACITLCRDPAVLSMLITTTRIPPPDAMERPAPPRLTLQQMAVMQLLADGQSTKEIARSLGLGLGTVKTHLSRAYAALGANNRVTALRAAGLLEPREN
jgi:DNA-binding CsgD family transcriptional regulator